MTRDRIMSLSIVAATLLTWLLFAIDADSPLRAVVAIAFLLAGPGLAIVTLFEIEQPLTALTLAVAASLGLETVVATALLEAGMWTPGRALAIVGTVTLAAVAAHLAGASFRPRAAPVENVQPMPNPVEARRDA